MTLKDSKEFIFARCADKKTAQEIKPGNPPELIFYDADGELIYRTGVTDLTSVEKAMKEALTKYAPKEIAWNAYDPREIENAKESKKLVVLAFTNDKEETTATLKAMEDRTIAKRHDRMIFQKLEWVKDSEDAKKWGVVQAPTVLFIDPSKEAGKQIVEKLSGKQSVNALRAAMLKGLAKIDAAK